MSIAETLHNALRDDAESRSDQRAQEWLDAYRRLAVLDGLDAGTFGRQFSSAGRMLSKGREIALETAKWDPVDAGRLLLLTLAVAKIPNGELVDFVSQLYWKGSEKEQAAIIRALSFLPDPARFVELAASAGRSHVGGVFEAIACENPYPARYFPDLNFNQLVLKALFVGTPLRRIGGLERRVSPELKEMAQAYASERRAAGRVVPEDVTYLLGKADYADF